MWSSLGRENVERQINCFKKILKDCLSAHLADKFLQFYNLIGGYLLQVLACIAYSSKQFLGEHFASCSIADLKLQRCSRTNVIYGDADSDFQRTRGAGSIVVLDVLWYA